MRQGGLQRPTFLTVLCILTFIGSGWGMLSNLFSLFLANLQDSFQIEQYSTVVGEIGSDGMNVLGADFLHSSLETMRLSLVYAREINIMQLVLGLISLLGAILMFQLRRFGFYLYTAAQILMLFVLPYFVGFSGIVWIGFIGSAFISVAFIAMYAVNVKYMTH